VLAQCGSILPSQQSPIAQIDRVAILHSPFLHRTMLLGMLDQVAHRTDVARNLLGDGGIVSLLFVKEDNGVALLSRQVAVSRSIALEQRWRRGCGCIGRLSLLTMVTIIALGTVLVLHCLPRLASGA
jgi:hypothetical protein